MILDKEREKKEVPWVLLKCVIYSRHMSYAGMWFNGSSRGVYVGAPLSCTETEWSWSIDVSIAFSGCKQNFGYGGKRQESKESIRKQERHCWKQ